MDQMGRKLRDWLTKHNLYNNTPEQQKTKAYLQSVELFYGLI